MLYLYLHIYIIYMWVYIYMSMCVFSGQQNKKGRDKLSPHNFFISNSKVLY